MNEGYISSNTESEIVDSIVDKYKVSKLPDIIWEDGRSDFSMMEIRGSDFPPEFDISNPNELFERKIISFYIPYENGKVVLLYNKGRKIRYNGEPITVNLSGGYHFVGVPDLFENEIRFSYLDFYNDPQKISKTFEEDKYHFSLGFAKLDSAFKEFNNWLPRYILGLLKSRVAELSQLDDYMAQLPFPIKKAQNLPEIFIPKKVVKVKKVVPKPVKTGKTETIKEYFITDEDYHVILGILFDCGKMWEKYPRLYMDRDEDTLRDQLLFVLVPNIDAVVAGEAYNKKGKTDISIKHGNVNLFIGECKIWKGEKVFLDTINQILGYLTWRDSKAAIMNFVPNKNFSKTISVAENAVKKHPNFVRKLEDCAKGWVNYRFHLDGDSKTFLTIAIQFYHLPGL